MFDSVLSKCGIICHTTVKGNNKIPILKDNWRLFIAKYILNNIEIETSKLTNGVVNSRINMAFLTIGRTTLIHSRRHRFNLK